MNWLRCKGLWRMAWVVPGGAQPMRAARTTSREMVLLPGQTLILLKRMPHGGDKSRRSLG